MDWRLTLTIAFAVLLLWRNLPGALLFVSPRLVRARPNADDYPVDDDLFGRMEEELTPLGFKRLGTHVQREPLRRGVVVYDFANDADRTWASAWLQGDDARLEFVTPLEGGGFVITADHQRMGIEKDGYLSGGLAGAGPEQLMAAHRRRIERMREAGRQPRADLSLDARTQALAEWLRGPGARELRMRHVNHLLLCAMGVVLVVSVARALV